MSVIFVAAPEHIAVSCHSGVPVLLIVAKNVLPLLEELLDGLLGFLTLGGLLEGV